MNPLFIDLFDATAQRRASHPAIVTDGADVTTYGALRDQAMAIAAHLPDGEDGRLVAVSIEKSSDYLAAVLACWYAGAAFLPLDPVLPAARRAHIIAEARPVCIITVHPEADETPQDCPHIALHTLSPQELKRRPAVSQDSTAYVIYTSGSTGAPKGVAVSHRGLVPVLRTQIGLFDLDEDTRSLFYLSTSFDASISDFGTALLAGGTLYIERAGALVTAAHLAQIIEKRGITYADLPPSLLGLLDPAALPASLRSICIGGEACPPAVVRRWAQTRRIVCVYGPTEATICTSARLCDPLLWQAPLIGDPLPGVSYSIRDRHHRPAQEGELYIAGPHLATGYLQQPTLTGQKFIQLDGQRWYRSGDRVRQGADGIEFLGRLDRQFKWRGQLVAPEEIETALCTLDGISRAAVTCTGTGAHARMIAHIESAQPQDAASIQAHLTALLPSWMVPTSIIRHARLPLSATGKINHAALARHVAAPQDDTAAFIPVSAAARALLHCWQRVLGRTEIPAQASFAGLGGDSFATLQLLLEAEKEGIALSPDFVSQHATISSQARHLDDPSPSSILQSADALRAHVIEHFPIPPAGQHAPAGSTPDEDTGGILLTGATGFLGRHLLLRLLELTQRPIHVLLRAATPAQALQRLEIDPSYHARLHVYCGDITQENLGLPTAQWDALAHETGTIVHCAASVNMALDYHALERANVGAVHALLRLAATGRAKRLHHASTLSVFVATDRNAGCAREDDLLEATKDIYGGYAQSKWAAEILLQAARRAEHRVAIHRLGLITGDSTSGAASPHDFLRMFAQGVSSLGHIPAGDYTDLSLDVTPVDYAADMLLRLVLACADGVFHIANTQGFSWPRLMQGLTRHGCHLTALDDAAWDSWLAGRRARAPLTPEESAAVMAMCRALPPPAFTRHRAMDLFQGTGIVFDTTQARAAIGQAWRTPPTADDALLDLYLRGFQLPAMRAKNAFAS